MSLFYQIVSAPHSPTLTEKAALLRLLDLLITDHFPGSVSTPDSAHSIARQIRDYLDAGQGMSVRLPDLEQQFSYSKFWLERQFRKEFGVSLMAYRDQVLMRPAKQLLQTETVSATADSLGFSSIYAFSRAFKNHFGIPPSICRPAK